MSRTTVAVVMYRPAWSCPPIEAWYLCADDLGVLELDFEMRGIESRASWLTSLPPLEKKKLTPRRFWSKYRQHQLTYDPNCTIVWNKYENETAISFPSNESTIGFTGNVGQQNDGGHTHLSFDAYSTTSWSNLSNGNAVFVPFQFDITRALDDYTLDSPLGDNGFGIPFSCQSLRMGSEEIEWQFGLTYPIPLTCDSAEAFANPATNTDRLSFNSPLYGDFMPITSPYPRFQTPGPTSILRAAVPNSIPGLNQQAQPAGAVPANTAPTYVQCNENFTRASGLARHIANIHSESLHLCPVDGCPRSQGASSSRCG